MFDLFLIVFLDLKYIRDLFIDGQTVGKIDAIVNLFTIYLIYKFYVWKFNLIKFLKKMKLSGIEEEDNVEGSVNRSLDSIELDAVLEKQSCRKRFFKWVFLLEEFSYKFKMRPLKKIEEKQHLVEKDKKKEDNSHDKKD